MTVFVERHLALPVSARPISSRFYSAGAVLGGSFILSGGHSANWPDKLDEMLELELPSKSWKALQPMREVRAKHGMVAVSNESIKKFCQN